MLWTKPSNYDMIGFINDKLKGNIIQFLEVIKQMLHKCLFIVVRVAKPNNKLSEAFIVIKCKT